MDDELHRYATDPRYRGMRWDEAEPELRDRWMRERPDTPWDDVVEPLRKLWERAMEGPRMTSAGRSDERDEKRLEH